MQHICKSLCIGHPQPPAAGNWEMIPLHVYMLILYNVLTCMLL